LLLQWPKIEEGHMRNAIKAAVVAISLALASPVAAQDIDAGFEAYQRGDYAAALHEYRPLAEQGHADAQTKLGQLYAAGLGVPQDYAEAVKWYRKAAEQGHVRAELKLGVMYRQGIGVPQDFVTAAKWFRTAAEQGHATAQLVLGVMYILGQGVAQDHAQAHMWFALAASQGERGATINRKRVARLMTPAQIAEAERLAREWEPK
jgi:TPR repeat protein